MVQKPMSTRVLTPANQITILRLAFVPIFAILVVGHHNVGALIVMAAAAFSDVLDGTVARVFRQVSPLGVALDPIADKVLMSTAFVTLSFRGALPWWLTIMVLSRDVVILITALLIILVAGYRPFYPTENRVAGPLRNKRPDPLVEIPSFLPHRAGQGLDGCPIGHHLCCALPAGPGPVGYTNSRECVRLSCRQRYGSLRTPLPGSCAEPLLAP